MSTVLGTITKTAASKINPQFTKAMNSDGRRKYDFIINPFEAKKGQICLIFERNPADRTSKTLPEYMTVKITKIDHMRESVRVSNGEYTWNSSGFGILL